MDNPPIYFGFWSKSHLSYEEGLRLRTTVRGFRVKLGIIDYLFFVKITVDLIGMDYASDDT